MNERRQRRATCALITTLAIVGAMGLGSGCDVQGPVDNARTAVAVMQTVVPGVQAALPGLQATAQAGSTAVAGVLADPQSIVGQLKLLLAGVSLDLSTSPGGVDDDAVTQVTITGTDVRGTFSQLDSTARQAAAGAAVLIVAQRYPNATISVSVLDAAGKSVLSSTKEPGKAPSIQ